MEDLASFFSTRALPMHLTRTILTSANLTVYQAESGENGDWTTVSLYPGLDTEKWGRMSVGVDCQSKLRGIPGVMQLLDCGSWHTSESEATIFTVEEWVEKDLAKDIEDHKRNQCIWTEETLISLAGNCISTLAEMQRHGIAHRNLNLHSLRYDSITQMIKLGNFTEACEVANDPISVIWTSLMSPELTDLINQQVGFAVYDPFKADVYSLGVCLLSCCCWDLRGPEEVEKNLIFKLQSVQSLSMKSLLYCMLQRNPENRPNFLDLQQYMYNSVPILNLSCPHMLPNPSYYNFPCHGKFCQSCVYFLKDSINCSICGAQYAFAQVQNITQVPITVHDEEVDMHFHLEEHRQNPPPAGEQIPMIPHGADITGPMLENQPRKKSCLQYICCCFYS